MLEVLIFRHELVEKSFQVTARRRGGIFHDDQAATGVLHEEGHDAVAQARLPDLRLHFIGHLVGPLPFCLHLQLGLVNAHVETVSDEEDQATPQPGPEVDLCPARWPNAFMQDDLDRILFHETTILSRLDQLATQISAEYRERELTVIAVLNGSLMFMADLLRRIPLPLKLDCLSVASYHGKAETSGEVIFKQIALPDVTDRHILILDDILDSGHTLAAIRDKLEMAKPRSIRVCVLLSKKKTRSRHVDADYIGFEIEDEFVVGYGLDFMERYRNLPYIGVLRNELISQAG